MMPNCSAAPFTAEELEILDHLRSLSSEAAALRHGPDRSGPDAAQTAERLARIRAEWHHWRRKAEQARGRRMLLLGHAELYDPDLIE